MEGLGYARNIPQGVTLPEDVARQESNHTDNERQLEWRQRRRLWSAARVTTRSRGEEAPSKSESSRDGDQEEDEDEEEGEITPSHCLLETSPHLVTSSSSKW
jgi:hypothetical protein